ncbi:MAG: LacI family DNA-binding transcriptional regulator [Waltera sp.]
MPATIKDIAKKVGVNPSTVSRVINGTASISEETRQKIKDAMKELDYHPNSLARSLVNGSTFTIGLVIDAGNSDAFSNAFFIRSVSAIEAVTQQRGFNLLITSDSDKEDNSAVKNLILEKKIDGIILPVSAATEELIDLLLGNHFPFIVLGEPDNVRDGIHWIDMDNKQGAEDAVNYLHRMGYEKTILLVENRITMFERKRIQGFQAAIGLNGKDVAENLIVECGEESNQIGEAIQRALNKYPDIDSIICTNNVVAYETLKFLKKKNIAIPGSIGIITFDNYPLAEYMDPPLTVVDIDTYKLGEEAANTLFSIIQNPGQHRKEVLLSTRIIERESTMKGEKQKK